MIFSILESPTVLSKCCRSATVDLHVSLMLLIPISENFSNTDFNTVGQLQFAIYYNLQINKVSDEVIVPKGKYPIFFYGTHETLSIETSAGRLLTIVNNWLDIRFITAFQKHSSLCHLRLSVRICACKDLCLYQLICCHFSDFGTVPMELTVVMLS